MTCSSPRIAIVADDLTGAADTAGGLVSLGPPWVTWRRPGGNVAWHGDDRVVAVDAGTRHLAAGVAAAVVRSLTMRFRLAGFTHLYKKIDSTLRGHVALEVRAALEGWHPDARAVIAPAFPAAGRTTYGGRQLVGGVPLDGPPLVDMLSSAGVPAAAISLADVRSGSLDRVFEARSDASSATAIVCDAVADSDLAAIAAAGAPLGERVVWVGSGGLARNMVVAFGAASEQASPTLAAQTGPVLIVCGSLSSISGTQAERLAREDVRHVSIPVCALSSAGDARHSSFAEIERELRAGADVLVTIEAARTTTGGADPGLVDQLGRLLAPCRPLAAALIATGGDTASAVLRSWALSGLRVVGEAEAGVPIGIATAPEPLIVALKAGAFGDAATLATARAAVRSLLRCTP